MEKEARGDEGNVRREMVVERKRKLLLANVLLRFFFVLFASVLEDSLEQCPKDDWW